MTTILSDQESNTRYKQKSGHGNDILEKSRLIESKTRDIIIIRDTIICKPLYLGMLL